MDAGLRSRPGLRESQISCHSPIQTVRELLENPVQPINDMSYFGCLDSVMENSKVSGKRSCRDRDREGDVTLMPWGSVDMIRAS